MPTNIPDFQSLVDGRYLPSIHESDAAISTLTYSAAELAKQLNCSKRHILALNASGRIPAPIRLGRCTRWLRSEIVEWLAAGAPHRDRWETMKKGGRR